MKKNLPTLTIGIPAYNEGSSIFRLLDSISSQKIERIELDKIIVYSDGSYDNTVLKCRQYRKLPIKVVDSKIRRGKSHGLNIINKLSSSNVLVILDADVMFKDVYSLSRLVAPILKNKADLCGGKVDELPTYSLIGRILHSSMEYKRMIFTQLNNGDNIYTCHGRIRAFSKKLYKTIKFKSSINEDAYSYLFTTYYGYKYKYIPSSIAYYNIPNSLRDHQLQSIRFIDSKNISKDEFGSKFVEEAYTIPKSLMFKTFITSMKSDLLLVSYIFLAAYISIQSLTTTKSNNKWTIAKSTKI